MARSWTIGSRSDCDLVVDLPKVSGHHCRLILDENGYVLEDLGSTNGTYVNGLRVTGRASVSRADAITLGLTTLMPWPSEAPPPGAMVVRIGRAPDNELVVDLSMVSSHHARVVWEGKPGEAWIEDLGSSNGTALGSPDRKITRSALSLGDTIYLGTHPIPAALPLIRIDPSLVPSLAFHGDQIVIGREPDCGWAVDLPMVSGRHARLTRSGGRVWVEDLASSNGTFVNGERVNGSVEVRAGDLIGLGSYSLILAVEPEAVPVTEAAPIREPERVQDAPLVLDEQYEARPDHHLGLAASVLVHPIRVLLLLLQAPILGIGIVSALRTSGPAATLFWLGMTAFWLGLSDAVLGGILDAARLRGATNAAEATPLLHRLVLFLVLGVCQCVVCWAIVAIGSGLKGPGLPSVGFLTLTALVGIAAGLLVVVLAPRPAVVWACLGPIMLALWLFGAERQALPRMDSWAKVIANALPSRWAFEGLLLLESDARQGAQGGRRPEVRRAARRSRRGLLPVRDRTHGAAGNGRDGGSVSCWSGCRAPRRSSRGFRDRGLEPIEAVVGCGVGADVVVEGRAVGDRLELLAPALEAVFLRVPIESVEERQCLVGRPVRVASSGRRPSGLPRNPGRRSSPVAG